jgi:hypothetical protein
VLVAEEGSPSPEQHHLLAPVDVNSWGAEQPTWTGTGPRLLEAPPVAPVIGLWWD